VGKEKEKRIGGRGRGRRGRREEEGNGREELVNFHRSILCILSSFISSIAFNGYKY
jgi:hypothetical protein